MNTTHDDTPKNQTSHQATQPPVQYLHTAQQTHTNSLAISGLITAFLLPPLGLLLSIWGLIQVKKTGEKGKDIAIVGIVMSSIFTAIAVILVAITILAISYFPKLQTTIQDQERKEDINAISFEIEEYYNSHKYYPAFENLNERSWRETYVPYLKDDSLRSPIGYEATLSDHLQSEDYSYIVSPNGCDNTKTKCSGYTLSTTLENNKPYTRSSLGVF